jgi:hypothetical protein
MCGFGIVIRCAWHQPRLYLAASTIEAGWPFKSMWTWERYVGHVTDSRLDRTERRGLLVPQWFPIPYQGRGESFQRRALPVLLRWPGFFLDTVLYALPWWALLATPGAIKRWRRKRRGACLACGYDLRGLGDAAACPECGRAARVAARRRPGLSDGC